VSREQIDNSTEKKKIIIIIMIIIIKGILNLNFRPFSFELKKKKIRFFEINFNLGFRVLLPRTLKIFKILFSLSSLLTTSREPKLPHNRLLTSIKLSRQFNPR